METYYKITHVEDIDTGRTVGYVGEVFLVNDDDDTKELVFETDVKNTVEQVRRSIQLLCKYEVDFRDLENERVW